MLTSIKLLNRMYLKHYKLKTQVYLKTGLQTFKKEYSNCSIIEDKVYCLPMKMLFYKTKIVI
jgi:hypothetical protein